MVALPARSATSSPHTQYDSLPRIQAPTSTSPASADKLTGHFPANAAQLTAAHKPRLNAAFRELHTNDMIVIAGRTDEVGSKAVNEALALALGLAVRDHLLDLDPALLARIAIDTRGRCCYAASNNSIARRASNRRVEVAYRQANREIR
jgi:outer membrane protein OmpA-like peptidoglycan-associated protein